VRERARGREGEMEKRREGEKERGREGERERTNKKEGTREKAFQRENQRDPRKEKERRCVRISHEIRTHLLSFSVEKKFVLRKKEGMCESHVRAHRTPANTCCIWNPC